MNPEEGKRKKISIYFIVPAPVGISPGQRFRFEHYLKHLDARGINYTISNFFTFKGWKVLYSTGNKTFKILKVLCGFLRRTIDLFKVPAYDFVYIYREATPAGPPLIEWIISKILRKRIIYDFDDAIWIPVSSEYNKTVSRFKNFNKVSKICKWSYKVTVGNDFLASYARQFNPSVEIIPTVVDTVNVHNILQQQDTDCPLIGWTGSFSTLPYLNMLLPVIRQLQEEYNFVFVVIADKDPRLPLKNYRFIPWNKEKEIADLLNFHIGVMPLTNDDISLGKCGFKAIQYMSLGIPAVVSPVGANCKIVDDGLNGFLCSKPAEWKEKLQLLLSDKFLRKKMGNEARNKIIQYYSVMSTQKQFFNLFSL